MPQVFRAEHAGGVGRVAIQRLMEPEQGSLFPELGVIDLPALRRERAEIAASQLARNTALAYRSDWTDFSGWCAAAGRSNLPASADTVSLYCVHLAQSGKLPSTIQRRCASIAHHHLAAGCASPIERGGDVREVLAGIRRKLGAAPKRAKAAVQVDDLRRMVGSLEEGVRDVRDRAVLLLGFSSGLRSAELVGLDLSDVGFERAGVVVRLARSKTDQEGKGRLIGIHRGRSRSTDPVQALARWIGERGRWPGPLICRLSRPGDSILRERLDPEAIAHIVRRAAERAGLDARRYAAHSLRAGFATAAAGNGAADRAIMARTGHRSSEMVGRYVRQGSLFVVDPLAGVL